ncbi:MAG: hypothetical protein V2A77_10905 [Pseudomonadota bacterium]
MLRYNYSGGGTFPRIWRAALERVLAARHGVWRWRTDGAGAFGADPRTMAFIPEMTRWRMSALSRRMLTADDWPRVSAARHRNYSLLLDHFRERHPEGVVSDVLPEGTCPLCFPLRLRKAPRLFARGLAAWGVEAWPWWHERFHPAVPWDEFPEARQLKQRVLALPVHQDLTEEHMHYLARSCEAVWRFWT